MNTRWSSSKSREKPRTHRPSFQSMDSGQAQRWQCSVRSCSSNPSPSVPPGGAAAKLHSLIQVPGHLLSLSPVLSFPFLSFHFIPDVPISPVKRSPVPVSFSFCSCPCADRPIGSLHPTPVLQRVVSIPFPGHLGLVNLPLTSLAQAWSLVKGFAAAGRVQGDHRY